MNVKKLNVGDNIEDVVADEYVVSHVMTDHAHEEDSHECFHAHTHMNEDGTTYTHTHINEDGTTYTHTHKNDDGQVHQHTHSHHHSKEEKKRQINRLAKATGHLQHIKVMIENDEDCAEVLIQLAAVRAALNSLGKEIINEHMSHCISHALEHGDIHAVEEFQEAIRKFI